MKASFKVTDCFKQDKFFYTEFISLKSKIQPKLAL